MVLIRRAALDLKKKKKQVHLAKRLPLEFQAKDGKKKCKKCKIIKNISDFCKVKTASDGLYSYCKFCKNEYNKNWLRLNREEK